MDSINEIKEKAGAREDKCNDQDRARALGSTGIESTFAGDEQNRTDNSSSPRRGDQREDINHPDSKENFGKILSQLREIEQSHLAYVGAHKKRLETRLNDAEEHERKFTSQVEAVEQQILSLMESLQ